MEQDLQIIGAKVINKNLIEISCIPFTTPGVTKKDISIMDLAMKGIDINELMSEAQSKKKNISKFYVTLDEWNNIFQNRILTMINIKIEVK